MDSVFPAHLPWYAAEATCSSLLVANRLRSGSGPPPMHEEGTEPAASGGGSCGTGAGVQLCLLEAYQGKPSPAGASHQEQAGGVALKLHTAPIIQLPEQQCSSHMTVPSFQQH